MRTGLIALALALCAGAAQAQDPPDMAAMAKVLAEQAPNTLSRLTLGQAQLPNYKDAQFRGMRAHYQRHELVNDQIVFCGEANIKGKTGEQTGWIKIAYLPGDPPTLISMAPGVGLREIGPQVYKTLCETGKEKWLQGDFTASFQKAPGPQG